MFASFTFCLSSSSRIIPERCAACRTDIVHAGSSCCWHAAVAVVLVLCCRPRACAGLASVLPPRIHRLCFADATAPQTLRRRRRVLAFACASHGPVQGVFDAGGSIPPALNTRACPAHLPLVATDARIADVALQSGAVFPNVKIAYEIHGAMNKEKSNVILVSDESLSLRGGGGVVCPSLGVGEVMRERAVLLAWWQCLQHPTSFGAQSEDLRYRIGPGSDFTLDSDNYCVVIVNLLGNGLSSSPSHAGSLAGYPMPTMYDNVMLHERLLREELQLDRPLSLIFGYSMGAMAALHFAALFPAKVERVAAVCGAATVSHYNRIFLASLKVALCTDPAWDSEARCFTEAPVRGLRAFGTIYAGWGLSPSFYREEEFLQPDVGDFADLDDFLERGYVSGFAGAEGHDLLAMLHTWDTGDVSANPQFKGDKKAALESIRAKTFLMPCESDRYFTVEDLRREAALFQRGVAELRPIPSSWGHRAGDPHRPGQLEQARFITEQVRALLAIESPQ